MRNSGTRIGMDIGVMGTIDEARTPRSQGIG